MGQCNSALKQLPAIASPHLDKERQEFLARVRSPESLAVLREVFSEPAYQTTKQLDSQQLLELNMLGLVTTNSQPGICQQGYAPLDWELYAKSIEMGFPENQSMAGNSGISVDEQYRRLGGVFSSDRRVVVI